MRLRSWLVRCSHTDMWWRRLRSLLAKGREGEGHGQTRQLEVREGSPQRPREKGGTHSERGQRKSPGPADRKHRKTQRAEGPQEQVVGPVPPRSGASHWKPSSAVAGGQVGGGQPRTQVPVPGACRDEVHRPPGLPPLLYFAFRAPTFPHSVPTTGPPFKVRGPSSACSPSPCPLRIQPDCRAESTVGRYHPRVTTVTDVLAPPH